MRFVTSAMRFDLRFMFYAQIAKTTGMKLSEARKRQLVLELTSGLMTLFWLLDQRDHDSDFVRRVSDMLQRAQHLLDEMSPVSLGRGTASWRQLQLVQPKSEMYGFCVERPELFVEYVRFTPAEFEQLHDDVSDILALTRNVGHAFTDEENRLRKRRRFKYSSRERLFHVLHIMKDYPKISESAGATNLTRSAIYIDFVWLREQLSIHPVLVAECEWPTPEKLEEQRLAFVACGLLEPPFDMSVFMCDGTKDLCRRNAHYNRQNEPDYSQKGNGKSDLMVRPAAALAACSEHGVFSSSRHVIFLCTVSKIKSVLTLVKSVLTLGFVSPVI